MLLNRGSPPQRVLRLSTRQTSTSAVDAARASDSDINTCKFACELEFHVYIFIYFLDFHYYLLTDDLATTTKLLCCLFRLVRCEMR